MASQRPEFQPPYSYSRASKGFVAGKTKKYLLKEKIFKGALKGGYRHILSFRETGKAEVRGLKRNRNLSEGGVEGDIRWIDAKNCVTV